MSNTTVLWEQIIAICPASLRYNLKILFSGHIVLAICQAPQPAEFVFWSQFLDIWHHWNTEIFIPDDLFGRKSNTIEMIKVCSPYREDQAKLVSKVHKEWRFV